MPLFKLFIVTNNFQIIFIKVRIKEKINLYLKLRTLHVFEYL